MWVTYFQADGMVTSVKFEDEHDKKIEELQETFEVEPSKKKVAELAIEELHSERVK